MKTVVIANCNECPFFQATPTLDFLLKIVGGNAGGTCGYDKETNSLVIIKLGLPEGVEREQMIAQAKRRIAITDRQAIPEACPLRSDSITVSLGS